MKFSKYLSCETGPASPRPPVIGMTVVASILLLLTLLAARMAYVLDTTGQRVQAEVVRFIDSGDDMHQAVFQFADAQGQVRAVPDIMKSSRRRYEIGEKVPIVFDKDAPTHVRKDSAFWLYFAPAVLGLMSMMFYGGAALIWKFRSHFQEIYEARRGRTIVTVVNSDGSVTQKSYSSVPVFRWAGIVLSGLGIAAWLAALVLIPQRGDMNGGSPTIGFSVFFSLAGSLLLLGAVALLRHAAALRKLE